MTEPTIVHPGGTAPTVTDVGPATAPTYRTTTFSTTAGPLVRPITPPPRQPAEPDPVISWLASDAARQYQHHWVALDPDTGAFRGVADTPRDFRRLETDGATIIYVDLPEPGSWTRD